METVGNGVVYDQSHMRESVPDWLTVYGFLGISDLAFTLVALQLGAREANPFLAHYIDFGLFEFVKISLTLLVLCICYRFRHSQTIVNVMAVANTFMATLIVYHVSCLSLLVF
jgi:hypothetical protein